MYAALCPQIASTKWFSKRWNFIWKTLNASSCTEYSTQECLAITARHRSVLLRAPGNWREMRNKVPQQTPSIWKQMRSTESLVEKEELEFKVDLRIEGIAQDVILKDGERMDKIQNVVDKSTTGYHTKSIIEDLGGDRKNQVQRRIESYNSRTWRYLIARVGTDTVRPKNPSELIPAARKIEFESCR